MRRQDFEFLLDLLKQNAGWEFDESQYFIIDKKISNFIREKDYNTVEDLIMDLKTGKKSLVSQVVEAMAFSVEPPKNLTSGAWGAQPGKKLILPQLPLTEPIKCLPTGKSISWDRICRHCLLVKHSMAYIIRLKFKPGSMPQQY